MRSRKSLLRLRMIWIRKSKSVETRFPVMSVVSFRRKKMSTRSLKLSRSVKPDLQLRKRNSRSRRLKYQSLTSSVYRNLKESLD